MTNYRTDIQEMLDIEKARKNDPANQFGYKKVEVTDIIVDLIYKNKNCYKAVGNRCFRASQAVRTEKNGIWFKRDQDNEETFIRFAWMKNADDIIRFMK